MPPVEGSKCGTFVRLNADVGHLLSADFHIPHLSFNEWDTMMPGSKALLSVSTAPEGAALVVEMRSEEAAPLRLEEENLYQGDVCCIPAGTTYRLRNDSRTCAVRVKFVLYKNLKQS